MGHKAVGPVCCVMHVNNPISLVPMSLAVAAECATAPCKPLLKGATLMISDLRNQKSQKLVLNVSPCLASALSTLLVDT